MRRSNIISLMFAAFFFFCSIKPLTADDATVLPKGVFSLRLDSRFYLPIKKRFDAHGNTEDLGEDFNSNLNSAVFPQLGQIEQAFEAGVSRPMVLYWGVRAQRDLYMGELPEQWASEHANFRFVPVLSEPDAGWQGRTGWVHEAVLEDIPDLSNHDLYMAGPPPMIMAARAAFSDAGMPAEHMHYDSFDYAADSPAKSAD